MTKEFYKCLFLLFRTSALVGLPRSPAVTIEMAQPNQEWQTGLQETTIPQIEEQHEAARKTSDQTHLEGKFPWLET